MLRRGRRGAIHFIEELESAPDVLELCCALFDPVENRSPRLVVSFVTRVEDDKAFGQLPGSLVRDPDHSTVGHGRMV